MSNCKQCSKPIIQKDKGPERLFCDNNNKCLQSWHSKNNPKWKATNLKCGIQYRAKMYGASRDRIFKNKTKIITDRVIARYRKIIIDSAGNIFKNAAAVALQYNCTKQNISWCLKKGYSHSIYRSVNISYYQEG